MPWYFTTSLIVEVIHESPSRSSQGRVMKLLCGNALLWLSYETAQWVAITYKTENWKYMCCIPGSVILCYHVQWAAKSITLTTNHTAIFASLQLQFHMEKSWCKGVTICQEAVSVFTGWFISKSLCFRRIEFSTFSGIACLNCRNTDHQNKFSLRLGGNFLI